MDVLPLLKAQSEFIFYCISWAHQKGRRWQRNERNWNEKLLHNLGEYTYILHASLGPSLRERELWQRVRQAVCQLRPTQKIHCILLGRVRNNSAKSNCSHLQPAPCRAENIWSGNCTNIAVYKFYANCDLFAHCNTLCKSSGTSTPRPNQTFALSSFCFRIVFYLSHLLKIYQCRKCARPSINIKAAGKDLSVDVGFETVSLRACPARRSEFIFSSKVCNDIRFFRFHMCVKLCSILLRAALNYIRWIR